MSESFFWILLERNISAYVAWSEERCPIRQTELDYTKYKKLRDEILELATWRFGIPQSAVQFTPPAPRTAESPENGTHFPR